MNFQFIFNFILIIVRADNVTNELFILETKSSEICSSFYGMVDVFISGMEEGNKWENISRKNIHVGI